MLFIDLHMQPALALVSCSRVEGHISQLCNSSSFQEMAGFSKWFRRNHKKSRKIAKEADVDSLASSTALVVECCDSPILLSSIAPHRQSMKLTSSHEIQEMLSSVLGEYCPNSPKEHVYLESSSSSSHGEICTAERVKLVRNLDMIELIPKSILPQTSSIPPSFGELTSHSALTPRYQSRISTLIVSGTALDGIHNLDSIYSCPHIRAIEPRIQTSKMPVPERCPSFVSQASSLTFSDTSTRAPSVTSSNISAVTSEASFYTVSSYPKVLSRTKALSTSLLLRRQRGVARQPNLDLYNPNTYGNELMAGPYPVVRNGPPSRNHSRGNRNSRVIPLSLPYNDLHV